MRIGSMEVTFHRTVRVAEGRQPSNLPPSLGHMQLYPVKDYEGKCPENWEVEGFFVSLHDTEAMWMSFTLSEHPVALLVGAGGVNALTGEKLGTELKKDNYLVAPPQPWLDGWKDKDGTVYQFVATPYKKGEGISVAEQLIGSESKTGALGIALFDPKDPSKLAIKHGPMEGYGDSAYGDDFKWTHPTDESVTMSYAGDGSFLKGSSAPTRTLSVQSVKSRSTKFSEMGVGKGGKIIQKIYPDPHGLEVWREKPSGTLAVYLVNAHVFEEITGIKVLLPVGHESYSGHWFGLQDGQEGDVEGTNKFTGLKSAVFPASNLEEPDLSDVEDELAKEQEEGS